MLPEQSEETRQGKRVAPEPQRLSQEGRGWRDPEGGGVGSGGGYCGDAAGGSAAAGPAGNVRASWRSGRGLARAKYLQHGIKPPRLSSRRDLRHPLRYLLTRETQAPQALDLLLQTDSTLLFLRSRRCLFFGYRRG